MTVATIHEGRRARAWSELLRVHPEVVGLLVTDPINVRYLCGFTGSNGALLLLGDRAVLGTDGRYVLQAAEESPDLEHVIDRATVAALARTWLSTGRTSLAVEADHLTVAGLRDLEAALGERPTETRGVIEAGRIVKEPGELELIRQACAISEAALTEVVATVRVGETERQIARRLEAAMFDHGADRLSFDTIVAVGPHSAIPHHSPTDRPVQDGDFLLIDFGADVAGYHADETRTFVVGKPDDWQREIHAIVQEAQRVGREAAVAGAELSAVDLAARSVIVDAGFGEQFGHGLGHGVGLAIHEAPFLSARATGMLLADSPVTVEPGVYVAGRGGVRIEDTVLITQGPCVSMTTVDRALVELG